MKTRVLSIILLVGVVGVLTGSQARAWNPFKKKNQPAAGQTVQHTSRKGKFMRGMRYISQRATYACDSSNAGRIDGFRRCLTSKLGKNLDMDKRSSVLALDKTGKPLSKSINRVRFKQEWFRRQMVLSNLSQQLLAALMKQEEAIAEEESEEKNADLTGDTQAQGQDEKLKMMQEILESLEDQLNDVWIQYGTLQEQMGQTAEYDGSGTPPLSPIPMPEASDPTFAPSKSETGPVMSDSFSASLEQFAQKNPNVMHNFCNNFFAVGPNAGYEANYVRMADTGDIKQQSIDNYQNAKLSIIAIKCSQNSMVGLLWRKLYSLCPFGQENETIAACSGFDEGETSPTQYSGG